MRAVLSILISSSPYEGHVTVCHSHVSEQSCVYVCVRVCCDDRRRDL